MTARWAWLFDIGSTFTKLAVVDLDEPSRCLRSQSATTVATDVREGFFAAVEMIEQRGGPRFAQATYRAASSSAAGGLAMVVSGLVVRLSAEAGRLAALGAGAKLVGSWAGRLTIADVDAMAAQRPDIVLLTGGTDGGDRTTVVENAQALAGWKECPTVVVAGNREASDRATEILVAAGISVRTVPNLLPDLDVLDLDPVREAIREEFLTNIVRAKGIAAVAEHLDTAILPTPGVVLSGVELLARMMFPQGVMVIEVGGATTNVHSWCSSRVEDGVIQRGLVEPALKRTVEGDLGVRWNASTILRDAGDGWFRERGLTELDDLHVYVETISAHPETLPTTPGERASDRLLATFAATTAVERHCGRQREVALPTGPVLVQDGKDLRRVDAVLGTGGSMIAPGDPDAILGPALSGHDPFALVPDGPRLLIDSDYVLYATGLVAGSHPDAGVELARRSLGRVPIAY